MMKSIIVQKSYGLQNLVIDNQVKPVIHSKEVLVKIKSVALNYLDLMIVNGLFGTPLPHIIGSDAVGVIEAIGSEVTSMAVGDVVITHFMQDWQSGTMKASYMDHRLGTNIPGVFSEYVALPASGLVVAPANLNYEQASTLPIAALTAWQALVPVGELQVGQVVLIQGTGGVSIFALQMAKALGAKVIITSSSDEKLEKAKQLGADYTINYKQVVNWQENVLDLTHGEGVDLALEMSWADVEKTIASMKFNGKIAVIGLLGGANVDLSVYGIIQKCISIVGIQTGPKKALEAMNRFIETHNIQPVIDRIFHIDQMVEAMRYLESGKHFGKIVLNF